MYAIARKLLFSLQPERAHHLTMRLLKYWLSVPMVRQWYKYRNSKAPYHRPVKVAGLTFKNPLGIGAGFDKNAQYLRELESLGFGYVEIGTVTPKPQDGNPQPRLFRLKQDRALINRMGFNNEGVDAVVARLKKRKTKVVIGGNIGKNKTTPNQNAVNDYVICFDKLHPYVDYFVVNVSSPNTPGLRELQDRDALDNILGALQTRNQKLEKPRPIFLKIAPDLTWAQIDETVEIVESTGIAGLIVHNTTIDRSALKTPKDEVDAMGNGGLSGAPLQMKGRAVLQRVIDKRSRDFAVISVGGIMDGNEGGKRLAMGADLIQIWTGFVYGGPAIIRKILRRV